jgi:hypothetical protein
MNSRNLQIEGAKAIRLPQVEDKFRGSSYQPFPSKQSKKDSSNHKNENQDRNTSKNQEIKKHFSA